MDKGKIFKFLVLMIVVMFTCLFIASSSGYYEYQLKKKTSLTDEAIKRFEEDVKEGKSVDINDYLDDTAKDYNNSVSNFNKSVSNGISKVFGETLKYIFSSINKAIEDN